MEISKELYKKIRNWVYASDDFNLINEVWTKLLNNKKINLERIMVEKESDCLDEEKLFANTIDETLAYINSLKKEGWTSIKERWSGYENNYFVACKTVLENNDDYAERVGREILNKEVEKEVLRREENERKKKEVKRLKDKINEIEKSIK